MTENDTRIREASTYNGITRTLAIKLLDDDSRYTVEDVREDWRQYCAACGYESWTTWLRASGWLDD